MTGEQYSREEDFHGDSIPSGNFVKAAVEIYTTDILVIEGKPIWYCLQYVNKIK
jgi:hypothetical protein